MRIAAAFAWLLLADAGMSADLDGKALYTQKLCHTCHGAEGHKPTAPNWPKLCGQNAAYIAEQSKFIRDGKRTTPMAVTMKPMVAAVSDDELQAIATYLEKACP